MIVPKTDFLHRYHIECQPVKNAVALFDLEAAEDFGIDVFCRRENAVCTGVLVEMDYDGYLRYQRLLNVSHYDEAFSGDASLFIQTVPYRGAPLVNDILKEMLPTRQREWALIPDVFVSVPVVYSSWDQIEQNAVSGDKKSNDLLIDLDFRTHSEAGVPSDLENVDDLANFKRRIQRFYLGKAQIQIIEESTVDHYADDDNGQIGAPANVDLYISLDRESNCAVLTWYSLSSPFLISQLMDNITRNNLMVIDSSGKVNFFDYVHTRFGLIKRGASKIFTIIPKDRNCLSPSQTASLLAAETIYPDGENFGKIIDEEIVSIVNTENGMGQYDRAVVFAYDNVVLQFSPDFKETLRNRLCEESITLFYIELILFEEAAIHIADRQIIKLFTSDLTNEPVHFLEQVSQIYDDYSKTIDFWNIQVKYPTSQKSIDMLRKAFRIKEQLEFMQRNQDHLQTVFDTKCDIVDRKDARRMDTSLAILSILAVFSAWIDGYDYIATWSDLFSNSTIQIFQKVLFVFVLITAGYAVTHLFGNRFSLILRHRREKMRRGKKRKSK